MKSHVNTETTSWAAIFWLSAVFCVSYGNLLLAFPKEYFGSKNRP